MRNDSNFVSASMCLSINCTSRQKSQFVAGRQFNQLVISLLLSCWFGSPSSGLIALQRTCFQMYCLWAFKLIESRLNVCLNEILLLYTYHEDIGDTPVFQWKTSKLIIGLILMWTAAYLNTWVILMSQSYIKWISYSGLYKVFEQHVKGWNTFTIIMTVCTKTIFTSVHTSNGHHGISNHFQIDYSFNSLIRMTRKHQSSILLALCAGNLTWDLLSPRYGITMQQRVNQHKHSHHFFFFSHTWICQWGKDIW